MTYYKFLRDEGGRARGPFSDFSWPLPEGDGPGPWVEAALPLELCGRGIHVCRPAHLPHWLGDRLWEVEAAGELLEADDKVVVQRARLVAQVAGWPERAGAFAEDCVWALRDLVVAAAEADGLGAHAEGVSACTSLSALDEALRPVHDARTRDVVLLAEYLGDAVAYVGLGQPAIVAYIGAHAADRAPRRSGDGLPRGTTPFDVERRRQAEWLAAALGLD